MNGLPYPEPVSSAVSTRMRANRRRDTKPETALASALHRAGLRFRRDYPIRPSNARPIRVDIAFTRLRVAIMVDGCFWHACPEHGTTPTRNTGYWNGKLALNLARDRRQEHLLAETGWHVLRVWEHEPLDDAWDRVTAALERTPSNGA